MIDREFPDDDQENILKWVFESETIQLWIRYNFESNKGKKTLDSIFPNDFTRYFPKMVCFIGSYIF